MQKANLDRLLRVSVVLLTVCLVYVIYAAIHQRVVEAGDSAPSFTVKADNGREVSVPNFGGKLLVLNFWASWCGPCVEETPSLSKFAADYADKGVVVLGISVDRDEKAYRAFLNRYRPAYLTVREGKTHEEYGTFMYPESYFIDAHGRVVKKIADPADFNDPALRKFVDSLL